MFESLQSRSCFPACPILLVCVCRILHCVGSASLLCCASESVRLDWQRTAGAGGVVLQTVYKAGGTEDWKLAVQTGVCVQGARAAGNTIRSSSLHTNTVKDQEGLRSHKVTGDCKIWKGLEQDWLWLQRCLKEHFPTPLLRCKAHGTSSS